MILRCLGLALTLSIANTAAAENANDLRFPVQVAILPDDGDPIAKSALCMVGESCEILTQERDSLGLSLTVPEVGACSHKELRLGCISGDCSFVSAHFPAR